MMTLNTEEAKLRLDAIKELEEKSKRCIIADLENADVRMKLHWLLVHVSEKVLDQPSTVSVFGPEEESNACWTTLCTSGLCRFFARDQVGR